SGGDTTLVDGGGENLLDIADAALIIQGKFGAPDKVIGTTLDLRQTDGRKQQVYKQSLTNPDIGSLTHHVPNSTQKDTPGLLGAFFKVIAGSGATLFAAPSTDAPGGESTPGSTILLAGTGNKVFAALGATIQSFSGGNEVVQSVDSQMIADISGFLNRNAA